MSKRHAALELIDFLIEDDAVLDIQLNTTHLTLLEFLLKLKSKVEEI
jgi:hypothetical protein